jgi:hypothetical protein
MEPIAYRFRIAVLVCLTCASGNAWAQSASDSEIDRWQAGAGFLGAAAAGEFETFVPDSIPGLYGHVNRSFGSIFSLGAEIAWNQYGSETRSLLLGPLVPEVPDASLEVHTYNAMVGLHGRLRAQLPRGRYRPYVDGLLGFTNIYTTSEVKGEDGCGEGCVFDSESQSSDFVLSYGGGAGIMINFSSRDRAPRLDLGMRYLRGGRADYLTEGSIHTEAGQLIRDFSRSRTDRFGVYVGAVIGR